jgi:hypothetical protein
MRRRIISKSIVFLILGAIVNVAVAWTSSVFVGFADTVESTRGFRASNAGLWNVEIYERNSALRVEWFRSRETHGDDAEGPQPASLMRIWMHFSDELAEDRMWELWDGEARGWPMLALWSRIREWHQTLDGTRYRLPPKGSIELPLTWFSGGMGEIPKVCPLWIIWPGFAINTLFYAMILWLLVAAPSALRRRLRIKRALCPACAYPTGASDLCSECGNAVKPGRGGAPAHYHPQEGGG